MENKYKNIPDDILELLAGSACGTLPENKKKQLLGWLSDHPQLSNECDEFRDRVKKTYLLHLKKELNHNQAWNRIHKQIHPNSKTRSFIIKFLPYAAIFVMLGGLVWYLYHSFEKKAESIDIVNQLPERTHQAILIQSNGKQIDLNNPNQINLMEKGDINITNKPGEILAYDTGDVNPDEVGMNKMIVPAGARYQLQLSDGTMVWMNSASEIEYPVSFGKNERRIRLEGEAYFEVKSDSQHPFIISTNGYEITVSGTAFNVSTYKSDSFMETTLVEGKVEVTGRDGKSVNLAPGQMVKIVHEDQSLLVSEVDTRFYTSWKDGVLHFNKVSLYELTVKLERWYNVNIEFSDKGKMNLLYSGAMENSRNIEFLFDLIEQTADVNFVVEENTIRVE